MCVSWKVELFGENQGALDSKIKFPVQMQEEKESKSNSFLKSLHPQIFSIYKREIDLKFPLMLKYLSLVCIL